MDSFSGFIVFVCVVEICSIVGVVWIFGVSVLVVGKWVVCLEEKFGVCLFYCSICSIILIVEGSLFFECSWCILVEIEVIELELL